MSDALPNRRVLGRWILIAYAAIGVAALAFDALTDRSFGASMLSVLPISFIAATCLLAGPWLPADSSAAALRNWLVGALLVLLISLGFSSLGADQAKTGELVFTYAALLMALPGSLVLPLAMTWLAPLLTDGVLWRIGFSWTICVAVGWLEWQALIWLYAKLRRQ